MDSTASLSLISCLRWLCWLGLGKMSGVAKGLGEEYQGKPIRDRV